MKKQTAIKKAGSVRQLAQLLGISTQAVHKWAESVPDSSLDALKKIKPEWFKKLTHQPFNNAQSEHRLKSSISQKRSQEQRQRERKAQR